MLSPRAALLTPFATVRKGLALSPELASLPVTDIIISRLSDCQKAQENDDQTRMPRDWGLHCWLSHRCAPCFLSSLSLSASISEFSGQFSSGEAEARRSRH